MLRKITMFFIVLLIVNIYVFSQDETTGNDFPKNTITMDALLTGASFLACVIARDPILGASIQYERQISNRISTAGRFEYKGMYLLYSDNTQTNMASFSVEAHCRYFPTESTFFCDGMLGYAFFNYKTEAINSMSHYFKFGGKLGWRIDFGKPGGFVLEPSLGYYFPIGNTKDIIVPEDDMFYVFNSLLNLMHKVLVKGYFVGGPQLSIGLGYRF